MKIYYKLLIKLKLILNKKFNNNIKILTNKNNQEL